MLEKTQIHHKLNKAYLTTTTIIYNQPHNQVHHIKIKIQ